MHLFIYIYIYIYICIYLYIEKDKDVFTHIVCGCDNVGKNVNVYVGVVIAMPSEPLASTCSLPLSQVARHGHENKLKITSKKLPGDVPNPLGSFLKKQKRERQEDGMEREE